MSSSPVIMPVPAGESARSLEADLFVTDQQGLEQENLAATGNLNIGVVLDYDANVAHEQKGSAAPEEEFFTDAPTLSKDPYVAHNDLDDEHRMAHSGPSDGNSQATQTAALSQPEMRSMQMPFQENAPAELPAAAQAAITNPPQFPFMMDSPGGPGNTVIEGSDGGNSITVNNNNTYNVNTNYNLTQNNIQNNYYNYGDTVIGGGPGGGGDINIDIDLPGSGDGEDIITTITNTVSEVTTTVTSTVDNIVNNLIDADIIGDVLETVNNVTGPVINIVGDVVGDVITNVDSLLEPVVDLVDNVLGDTITNVESLLAPVTGLVENVLGDTLSNVTNILDGEGDIIQEVINAAENILSNVTNTVGDVLNGVGLPLLGGNNPLIDLNLDLLGTGLLDTGADGSFLDLDTGLLGGGEGLAGLLDTALMVDPGALPLLADLGLELPPIIIDTENLLGDLGGDALDDILGGDVVDALPVGDVLGGVQGILGSAGEGDVAGIIEQVVGTVTDTMDDVLNGELLGDDLLGGVLPELGALGNLIDVDLGLMGGSVLDTGEDGSLLDVDLDLLAGGGGIDGLVEGVIFADAGELPLIGESGLDLEIPEILLETTNIFNDAALPLPPEIENLTQQLGSPDDLVSGLMELNDLGGGGLPLGGGGIENVIPLDTGGLLGGLGGGDAPEAPAAPILPPVTVVNIPPVIGGLFGGGGGLFG